MRALLCGAAVALTAVTALAEPTMAPLGEHPVNGVAVVLSFSDEEAPVSGLEIAAIYRENAHATLRHRQRVGVTDAAGRIEWTPEAAGVVVLKWAGGSTNVSVVHAGTPTAAVWVAVLAGVGLLGGSVLFFLQMLRSPDPQIVAEEEILGEPPST